MTVAIITLGIILALSLSLNALLLIVSERKEKTLLEMFRRREGLELPEEMEQAKDAEVVRTAKDILKHQQMRARRRSPAFSIPLPGTDWMKRADSAKEN